MSRDVHQTLQRVLAIEDVAARVTELRNLTLTDPDQPLAWLNLADDLARTGEFASARSAAVRACALDPDVRSCITPRITALFESGEGAVTAQSQDPAAGRVSGYRIAATLARSESQVLYDAVMLEGNKPVTLRRMLDLPPKVARDQMQRELVASQRAQDVAPGQTSAAKVLTVATDEYGVPYQVLDRVKGRPLSDICGKGGVDISVAVEITTQLALMLDPMHRAGLFHGDLRPDSVLVDGLPEHPTVTLMGLGGTAGADPTRIMPLVESRLRWLAPELATPTPIDGRTDVYGLGLLFFYSLTGRLPPTLGARLRTGMLLGTPADGEVLRGVQGQDQRELLLRVGPVLNACVGPFAEDRPISAASLASALAGGRLRIGRNASGTPVGVAAVPRRPSTQMPIVVRRPSSPALPVAPRADESGRFPTTAPPLPGVASPSTGRMPPIPLPADPIARASMPTDTHSRGALLATEKIDRSRALPPARMPDVDDALPGVPPPAQLGDDGEPNVDPFGRPQFTGSFPTDRTGSVSLPWAAETDTPKRRGLTIGLALVGALIVFGGGGYFVLHGMHRGPSVEELEAQADRSLAALDWDGALVPLEQALVKEPARASLADKKHKAEEGKKEAAVFARYEKAVHESDNATAIAAFAEIPEASPYHAKAADTIPLIRRVYLQDLMTRARHAQSAMKCEEAQDFAKKALALDATNVEAQDISHACEAHTAIAQAPVAAVDAPKAASEDPKAAHKSSSSSSSSTASHSKHGKDDSKSDGKDDAATLPTQLTQSQVKSGIGSIQSRVDGCFDRYKVPGVATITFIIGNEGRVQSAVVQGEFTGKPTGICVSLAVRAATFGKFTGAPMSVTYPFNLK